MFWTWWQKTLIYRLQRKTRFSLHRRKIRLDLRKNETRHFGMYDYYLLVLDINVNKNSENFVF